MIRKMSAAFAFALLATVSAAAQEANPASAQEAKPSPVQEAKPAAAQDPKPADTAAQAPVTVIVADTAAPQEWEVSVPVAVKLEDGTQLGRLSMKLVYSSKVLKYASVKSTETLKGAGFEVTAGTPVVNGDHRRASAGVQAHPRRDIAEGHPVGSYRHRCLQGREGRRGEDLANDDERRPGVGVRRRAVRR